MFWSVTQTLMSGLATTFEIFILTLVFALPLGLVIAFGLMSKFKPLRYLLEVIVWVNESWVTDNHTTLNFVLVDTTEEKTYVIAGFTLIEELTEHFNTSNC